MQSPAISQSLPATITPRRTTRDVMGEPQVKFGDSEVLLVHLDSGRLVGCPVSEHSRHLLGGREKRRVVVQGERHQGQSFTVTRASEEQAKAAGVVQLMETSMRDYVKKLEEFLSLLHKTFACTILYVVCLSVLAVVLDLRSEVEMLLHALYGEGVSVE